jgi:hypothetical protein
MVLLYMKSYTVGFGFCKVDHNYSHTIKCKKYYPNIFPTRVLTDDEQLTKQTKKQEVKICNHLLLGRKQIIKLGLSISSLCKRVIFTSKRVEVLSSSNTMVTEMCSTC